MDFSHFPSPPPWLIAEALQHAGKHKDKEHLHKVLEFWRIAKPRAQYDQFHLLSLKLTISLENVRPGPKKSKGPPSNISIFKGKLVVFREDEWHVLLGGAFRYL